jgi:hypothetical protein
MIIANMARFSRNTVRDREDAERGDRYRRRQAMQALARSQAYDHAHIPQRQRR